MTDTVTDVTRFANLILYIESSYEVLGKPVPQKPGGGLDVLRAKAFLLQLAYQGTIPPFEAWHKQMFGVLPDGTDGWDWPPQEVMPWPPFKALDLGLGALYGG